jgi:hypothetical protein
VDADSSKNVQKSIDTLTLFCNIRRTHGKNTNYKNMRTKALLCAAALAAGALSVVAQGNVYSLNVVGYVNVSAPAGYSILANPLSAGATNGANEIMPITDGEVILTYVNGSYKYNGYDSGFGGWIDENANPSPPPALPPGKGFFYFNPAATAQAITFVGQVVPSPGVTNSLSVAAGYSLIGSPMPVSGQLGTVTTTGIPPVPGAVNLPIIDGMTLLPYVAGSYQYKGFDSGFGGWIDENASGIVAPTITAGVGFFFFNPLAGSVQWQQALP